MGNITGVRLCGVIKITYRVWALWSITSADFVLQEITNVPERYTNYLPSNDDYALPKAKSAGARRHGQTLDLFVVVRIMH